MRMAFISYLHGFGGAEKQNVMLANAMAERGHEVFLISISADNNCYNLNKKVKYFFIPDRTNNAFRIATRYQDVKKLLKSIKPDVTINFWFQSAYFTALMTKKITGKVIYSERGDPGDAEYAGLLGIIRTIVMPRIDGFVFQSRGAQAFFDERIRKRSVVISNPVFIRREDYPEIEKRRKVIVTIGRLHSQKNQKLLIDAFAVIADQIPEYTLEIYGDGELKYNLQKHIDSLSLHDRVFLKGTSKEIHKLIYDASLFVLCSDYEGIPNTLLEAMALGLPCISTDCRPGGARELIDDGDNGIIVPVNDIEKLSSAILLMLKKEAQELSRISCKAQEKTKKFLPTRIYSEWEEYIFTLMQR